MNKVALAELIENIEYRLIDHSVEDDSWYNANESTTSEIECIIQRAIFPLFNYSNTELEICNGIWLYPSGKVIMNGTHISVGVLKIEKKVEPFFEGILKRCSDEMREI
jgi:hypothetical protein